MGLMVPRNCDELLDCMDNYKLLKKGLCCMEAVCQVSGVANWKFTWAKVFSVFVYPTTFRAANTSETISISPRHIEIYLHFSIYP
jgi:hypothetical protein